MLLSVNPYNCETVASYKPHTPKQAHGIVLKTHAAWLKWKHSKPDERSNLLIAMAKELLNRKTELAQLMAAEMGKPVKQGIAEIEKCAACCEYYAERC